MIQSGIALPHLSSKKKPFSTLTSHLSEQKIGKKKALQLGIEPRSPANCLMTSRNTNHYTTEDVI
jgi:hypothetical protein